MKSIDWSDAQNYRNRCVAEIMELCLQLGLDSTATEKKLTIKLPSVEEIKVWPEHKQRKVLDWDKIFPSSGEIEGEGQILDAASTDEPSELPDMPDELEPPNYTLEEGEPPIDKDAEK